MNEFTVIYILLGVMLCLVMAKGYLDITFWLGIKQLIKQNPTKQAVLGERKKVAKGLLRFGVNRLADKLNKKGKDDAISEDDSGDRS